MAKRSQQQKSKHDAKVKQIAQKLSKEGWNVRADIDGYEQPDPIGKKNQIPDIQAIKKGAEKIIEVETEESMKSDKEQHATFRRSASHKPKTTFQIEEA